MSVLPSQLPELPRRALPAVGLLAVALPGIYLAAPPYATVRLVVMLLAAIGALTAALWRARRAPAHSRAPWLLFAGAAATFLVAVTGQLLTTSSVPFAGGVHLLRIMSLVGLTAALILLVRRRSPADLPSTIDALVVGLSTGTALWMLLVAPAWQELPGGAATSVALVVSPLLAVVVLVVSGRLALSARRLRAAELCLLATCALFVIGMVARSILLLGGTADIGGDWLDLVWVLGLVSIGLTAALPSARSLMAPDDSRGGHSSPHRRIVGLALAALVLPGVHLHLSHHGIDVALALVTAVVMLAISLRVALLLHGFGRSRDADVAEQRERDRRRLEALVSNATDVVLVLDGSGTVTWASPSSTHLLGTEPTGWSRARLAAEIHEDEREATLAALDDRLRAGDGRPITLTARLCDRDGGEHHVDLIAVDLRHDPDVEGVVITLRETTQRAVLEAELRRLAYHDTLTGLPNREVFQERLGQALRRAHRGDRRVAVLLCDLDDFKDVNDTLGHPIGDGLLQQLARRFAESMRITDTVARLGGDEFAVLCEDLDTAQDAVLAARRLLAATDAPIEVDGVQLHIGLSVGIAFDTGERNSDELLRDADVALYEAKSKGKQRWSLHRASMTMQARARLQLSSDLAMAVRQDQLHVSFQPVVALEDDRIVGAEALARWQHPTRGEVAPSEFIPLAERNGLIVELGERILDAALAALADWDLMGPVEPLRVGVNVSARQLREPGLVERVLELVSAHRLRADRLVLELTESVLLEDADQALEVMHGLRDAGVRFAIDDFGTGFSSLSYLRKLPIDIVKIDRSFVHELSTDPAARELVQAIIGITNNLRLDVLAEGVETDEQRDLLRTMGCTFAQGYRYAPPTDRTALGRLLSADEHPSVTS